MTRADYQAHQAVRSTPRWGSLVPDTLGKSFGEEESQIKLRAPLPPEAYYQEDPFPLVRQRVDDVEELPIDITFDDAFATRDTPVMPRRESVRGDADTVLASGRAAPMPAYGAADRPYPPSFYPSYFESPPSARDVSPYPAPRRVSARTVLSRVVFGLIFFAVSALLAYEIRVLLLSGTWPLP
jgi:hypothetical protein